MRESVEVFQKDFLEGWGGFGFGKSVLKIKILLVLITWSLWLWSRGSSGGHKITVLIWPVCFNKSPSALDTSNIIRKKIKRPILVLKIY